MYRSSNGANQTHNTIPLAHGIDLSLQTCWGAKTCQNPVGTDIILPKTEREEVCNNPTVRSLPPSWSSPPQYWATIRAIAHRRSCPSLTEANPTERI